MKLKMIAIVALTVSVVAVGVIYITLNISKEPTQADLERFVSENIEAYPNYNLKSLTIISSEVESINGMDTFTKEFEARIAAVEARFSFVETIGDFIFIDYAVQPGHEATVMGDLFIFESEGDWRGDISFSRSRNLLSGSSEDEIRRERGLNRTVVLVGTPAEVEARAAIEESSNILTEDVVGEWIGRGDCRFNNHKDYVMILNDEDGSGILNGEVSFSPSEDSRNKSLTPGSFTVKAEVIEIKPVGLFTLGGYPFVVRHDSWIEQPGRELFSTFHLDFEGEDLVGKLSQGGDVNGASCDVRFRRR